MLVLIDTEYTMIVCAFYAPNSTSRQCLSYFLLDWHCHRRTILCTLLSRNEVVRQWKRLGRIIVWFECWNSFHVHNDRYNFNDKCVNNESALHAGNLYTIDRNLIRIPIMFCKLSTRLVIMQKKVLCFHFNRTLPHSILLFLCWKLWEKR